MQKTDLAGMAMEELRDVVAQADLPSYAARQIAHRLYRCNNDSFADMVEIPAKKRIWLEEHYHIGWLPPATVRRATDGTVKYLFTPDNVKTPVRHLETVYIPSKERGTVCLSTQLGCRMGCHFCMTARGGFSRNLTAGEILNQLRSLPEYPTGITNAVFMGMGEPMDNIEAVLRALDILTTDWGYGWSPRRITVSTVGVPEAALRRFLEESHCRLAVSIHSPFPAERATWMPAEQRFPVKELIQLLRKHDFGYRQRLSFEYILFRGLNDSERHATELARLLRPLPCRVNLIRFHPLPDTPFQSPTEEEAETFCRRLNTAGLPATVRASRGQDIEAACGLLSGTA